MVTAIKRPELVNNFIVSGCRVLFPSNQVEGMRRVRRGVIKRIANTAIKESWNDTSNREYGDTMRIRNAARASVL